MRKIVQIATVQETDETYGGVYGLCNDGSVLLCVANTDDIAARQWHRLPDIPQDQPPAKEAE